MENDLNDIWDKLKAGHEKDMALISIAISFKRIADAMEKPNISGGDVVISKLSPDDWNALEEHWRNAGSYEIIK